MFDIGFWELAIISIVALLVMGPEKMPGLIRDVSKWARSIRRFVSQTRSELEREFSLDADMDLKSRISDLDELVKNAPDKLDAELGIQDSISELDKMVNDTPVEKPDPEKPSLEN